MKRRTKLFLFLTSILTLGGIGVALNKIQHNAEVPFPGAVSVLDDTSWRSREGAGVSIRKYLWGPANTVLYTQSIRGKEQVIRRRVSPNGKPTPPETLPISLTSDQYLYSLSPNGNTLCLIKISNYQTSQSMLLRMDGTGKPVAASLQFVPRGWSPDSKYLYSYTYDSGIPLSGYIDAQTGKQTQCIIKNLPPTALPTVTPNGKLLFFDYTAPQNNQSVMCRWSISEVQGNVAVTTKYQKQLTSSEILLYLSPDGKRLLWSTTEEEVPWLARIQQTFFRMQITPIPYTRYHVTDIDGKNERTIGVFPLEVQQGIELYPEWTPDSNGVHFLQDGKLMYLAVP